MAGRNIISAEVTGPARYQRSGSGCRIGPFPNCPCMTGPTLIGPRVRILPSLTTLGVKVNDAKLEFEQANGRS